jgi:excinuclease ABC subunit B
LAEDLSAYIDQRGYRGRYLHSEINTLERVEILNDLRRGEFDVLVGVNLLREGLDLPEVSLVAIMDADKEGFLRSETSLIQTIGRTARNVNAEVILYADKMTHSMQRAIDETNRRREIQIKYNADHGITPETIRKAIRNTLSQEISARKVAREAVHASEDEYDRTEMIAALEKEMLEAAESLDFERAAMLRDRIREMRDAPKLEAAPAGATDPTLPFKDNEDNRDNRGSGRHAANAGNDNDATTGDNGGDAVNGSNTDDADPAPPHPDSHKGKPSFWKPRAKRFRQ